MTQSLLQTKFYIPRPRPSLVNRPQLIERLDAGFGQGQIGVDAKLSLIAAPAGYGKTTLVAAWVERLLQASSAEGSPAVAWLSLDDHDNDTFRFLAYLVAAIQGAYPALSAGWLGTVGSAGGRPEWQLIVQALVNDLAALPGRLVLVLDDFHVIDDQAILDLVATLVDYGPPNNHLVITSRAEPSLPLSRWRARNQLTEIRTADLRFDPGETAAFLRQTMGLSVDEPAVATLETSTEGWVAGLQLAALALGGSNQPDSAWPDLSGRHPHIADYLMAEVFNRQPAAVQAFLLTTAILDRFCGPLCDRLVGHDHNQELLEHLEQRNLFLVPLDGRREWYRYHHLFGQLLRDRLGRDHSPAEIARLHQTAADWFAEQQLTTEAIDHAFRAGNADQAARLMAATPFNSLWEEGQAFQFQRWVRELPENVCRSQPMTLILAAAAHMLTGDIQPALDYLDSCEGLEAVQGEHGLLTAIVLRNQGRVDLALARLEAALPRLPGDPAIQAQVNHQFALCLFLSGRLDEADATLARLSDRMPDGDPRQMANYLLAANLRSVVARSKGDFYRAYRYGQEAIDVAAPAGQPVHPLAGVIYSDLADIYYEWNELGQANRYAALAVDLGRRSGITDALFGGLFRSAELAVQRGDGRAAREMLATIRHTLVDGRLAHILAEHEAYEAGLDLRLGDLAAAGRWANASGLSLAMRPTYTDLDRQLLLARVRAAELIEMGRVARASGVAGASPDPTSQLLDYLGQILALASSAGHRILTIQTRLTRAVLLDQMGRLQEAVEEVTEALRQARPGSLVRIFLDQRPEVDHLLARASAAHGLEDYVGRLLLAVERERRPGPTLAGDRGQLLNPLTEREIEVLQQIAAGLSNREIEERLFISRNTVRSHIKNLYGKLGVTGRNEAIRRARELRLI